MSNQNRGWRRYQRKNFDSRHFQKRIKKVETATTRHAHRFIIRRLDSVRSVQRQIIGWLVMVGVLIAATGFQLMWFQRSYQTTAAEAGGTYAEGVLGPIDTLNPLYASSDAEASAVRLIFSSLYKYDKTGNLHGDIASSLKVDPTGKVYQVRLRSDVKWHDGTALTAKDVAFTVNLIKNPEVRSPLRINWRDIKVEALNDTTVQFTLPAVYAAFPNALTFSVLPEHLLKAVAPATIRENTFSRAPVGSGPFSLTLLQNGNTAGGKSSVQMQANERYFGGTPKLSRFELRTYQNAAEIVKALRSGEVNAAQISPTLARQLDSKSFKILSRPINGGVYALINVERPQLKDKAVRQALQAATDTAAIRRLINNGVKPMDLPFIRGQLSGSDVPAAPGPDKNKAAKILDEAGWKLAGGVRQKDNQKLALTITTTKSDQYEKVLEDLAKQWRSIGITVTTNVIDTANPAVNFIQNTLQPRNYDVLLYELSIGADPDVYAYWHSSQIGMSGYNFSNYASQAADDALASARSRLEPELRSVKYKTFARQWLADVPAIGLYQSSITYASNMHTSALDNSMKLVTATDRYANILDWTVREKSVYKTP